MRASPTPLAGIAPTLEHRDMDTVKRKHPHFDDRGTLSWHTRWKDALAQAKAENKKIFIELGREL